MIRGSYKSIYAIPCHHLDKPYFQRMMSGIAPNKKNHVFVRQVKVGDILISDTNVRKWRIISENSKLYLGFYETPLEEKEYEGYKRPKAYYLVEEDIRQYTTQKYMLVRIPEWEAMRHMGKE